MDKAEVHKYILEQIEGKLIMFNIGMGEVDDDFDLVKSGLLDSMAFVDLVAGIEEQYKIEIDFEKAVEDEKFTSMGGLVQLILNTSNA